MRRLEDAHDLVIVGTGPGGCAAAIWAARHDLSTALVEAPRGSGAFSPAAPLEPGVETLLWHLGLLAEVEARGLLGSPGAHVAWDERRSRRLTRAIRPRWGPLERFLLQKAAALGVNVLRPCHAKRAMLRRSGRIVGVDTELGPVVAELTLDAAGRGRWLGSQLGLDAPRCAGSGYFLLGDATGAARRHGVLRAMISGIKAAELSDKLLHDELSEPQAARQQEALLERLFRRDLAAPAEIEACSAR
ncbi:MAG TPA: hypothetical protein DEA08_32150 [Planctomycetes bacterium]|nr:hypothetical protein [Planctomycetota bacterium]